MRRRSLLRLGVLTAVAAAGCDRAESSPSGAPFAAVPSTDPARFDADAYQPPEYDAAALRELFRYDTGVPLDAIASQRRDDRDVVLEELAYDDGAGGAVPTVVLSPRPGRGRLPAVVFAHGEGADHKAFLAEARRVCTRGAVCLLPRVGLSLTGHPVRDSAVVTGAVVAQRRALDLLAGRDDVDPARLGFVGHGWGGMQAQILAGVEPRLGAVVAAAVGGRLSRWAFGQTEPADPRAYLDALSRFDGVRYLAWGAARTVLLQGLPAGGAAEQRDAQELTERTAAPRELRDYAPGVDLATAGTAVADRVAFLARVLRLA